MRLLRFFADIVKNIEIRTLILKYFEVGETGSSRTDLKWRLFAAVLDELFTRNSSASIGSACSC